MHPKRTRRAIERTEKRQIRLLTGLLLRLTLEGRISWEDPSKTDESRARKDIFVWEGPVSWARSEGLEPPAF
jgi:hypothetical protein